MPKSKASQPQPKHQTRSRIKQSDVPAVELTKALRIPQAIVEHYASKPTKPLNVAAAMNVQPSSGPFRTLCGASIAYGLTIGGYNVDEIEITDLAKRILRPVREGDDLLAKREALLNPRVLAEFLTQYDGSPLPKEEIAFNVLEGMGVPRDRAPKTFELIRV